MRLQSLVQDALYLNWALPVSALPPLPEPLRYQTFEGDGPDAGEEEHAYASALLFRHRGLHVPHLPLFRFTYPQLNLRLYAVDADRMPSVVFIDMLMPWWVGPAVRWVAKSPASTARFTYPRPSDEPEVGEWSWEVRQGGRLEVRARRGAPAVAGELGGWRETVRFFRDRPRGYLVSGGKLRRVETEYPRVEVWPMVAEVAEDSLLQRVLPVAGGWPRLHSSWLCPEVPFVFDLAVVPQVDLEGTLSRAAASTRSVTARSGGDAVAARSAERRPSPSSREAQPTGTGA